MGKVVNINDLDLISEPDEPSEEAYGLGETALRHGLQGSTLGFSDELRGLGAGALASLQGRDLLKAYQESRDLERKALEESAAENPLTAGASELAGGLLIPAPGLGALKGAASLAKVGKAAAGGALLGGIAGTGKAAELSGIPEEAAGGALLGGVVGGALPIAGSAVLGAGKKTVEVLRGTRPIEAAETLFREGVEGRSYLTQRAGQRRIDETLKPLNKEMFAQLSSEGDDKIRKTLAAEFSEKVTPDIKALKVSGLDEKLLPLLQKLDDELKFELPADTKAELLNITGRLNKIPANPTVRDVHEITKGLSDFVFSSSDSGLANKLGSEAFGILKDSLKEVSPDIARINTKYAALYKAKKQLGLTGKTAAEASEVLPKLRTLINQVSELGPGTTEAKTSLKNLIKNIKNTANPQTIKELRPLLKRAITSVGAKKDLPEMTLISPLSLIKTGVPLSANLAGLAVHKINGPIMQSIASTGKQGLLLANSLNKLTGQEVNTQAKKALIFALTQDPNNRALLKEHNLLEDEEQ